jgi:hypothetical protein
VVVVQMLQQEQEVMESHLQLFLVEMVVLEQHQQLAGLL